MLKNKKLITEKDFRSYKLIYDEQGNLKTDLQLLYALKTWRSRVMKQRKIPSTCVFYNSCLVAFATYYPRTRDEFLRIFGVGKTKWEQFGAVVVNIITTHLENKNVGIDEIEPF